MNNIGKFGENYSVDYLLKNGWVILNRNYRRKSDEIDIIAMAPDKTLVFCEVKTLTKRTGDNSLLPEDNLSRAKFNKISRTCEFFARKFYYLIDEYAGWRIDLIAIDLDKKEGLLEIRHYKNI